MADLIFKNVKVTFTTVCKEGNHVYIVGESIKDVRQSFSVRNHVRIRQNCKLNRFSGESAVEHNVNNVFFEQRDKFNELNDDCNDVSRAFRPYEPLMKLKGSEAGSSASLLMVMSLTVNVASKEVYRGHGEPKLTELTELNVAANVEVVFSLKLHTGMYGAPGSVLRLNEANCSNVNVVPHLWWINGKNIKVSRLQPLIMLKPPFYSNACSVTKDILRGGDIESNPGPNPGSAGGQPAGTVSNTRTPKHQLQVITQNVRGLGDSKKVRHLVNNCYKLA